MDTTRLLGGIYVCLLTLGMTASVIAAPVSGQGTWENTLLARDLDGNTTTIEAYYDTDLNITWLADANYAATIGPPPYSPSLEDGRMNMPNARDWTTSLNIGGVTGWRLPDVTPVDGLQFNTSPSYDGSTDVGYNVSAPGSAYPGTTVSELAHMFYATLGNTGRIDMGGINNPAYGLINTGPFTFPSNPYYDTLPYWTGVLVDPTDWEGSAYVFTLNEGQQRPDDNLIGLLYSWPVHDGDAWPVQGSNVAAIPLPPVLYLFGSGLLGLIGIARKNVSSKDVIAAITSHPMRDS